MAFETVTGYCWPQSATGGEHVGLHVSSPGGRPVTVEVARVGAEREVVHTATIDAGEHDVPADAATEGCGWPAAARIEVDPEWRSGYYEVVLDVDLDGRARRSHAFFVVRPPVGFPSASILLALATNTWHAYNDFGGRNLYTGATQVSLQRPMSPGYLHKPPGKGRRVTVVDAPDPQMAAHVGYLALNHLSPWAGSAGWPDWELPFIQWAERHGYRLDVCTNADLDHHPGLLQARRDVVEEVDGRSVEVELEHYRLFLSVGHDEYWSGPMRDAVERFVAEGGNACFFSGNTSFWQVRLEDPTPEGPAGTMVGYKGFFKQDPVYDTDRIAELTSMWSDHEIGRPENQMTGVSFSRGGYHRIGKVVANGAGGYTIHRPEHWIFEGSGLGYGDVLGAEAVVVGYECDGCDFTTVDGVPVPTGADGTPPGFQILGTAPATHFDRTNAPRPPRANEPSEIEFIAARLFGTRDAEAAERIAHGHAVLGTYTSAGGGTVITSGSTEWAHGLTGRSPQVEHVTRTILDRLS